MKLINNNIIISSHKKLLMKLEDIRHNDFIEKIQNYGRIVDEKIEVYGEHVARKYSDATRLLKEARERGEEKLKLTARSEINKIELKNSQLKELKEIAKNINLNEIKSRVENINFELTDKTDAFIDELENKIKRLETKTNTIDKYIQNKIEEILNSSDNLGIIFERLTPRKCPKCGGDMKIGKGISLDGYNWYCKVACGGFISGDKTYV